MKKFGKIDLQNEVVLSDNEMKQVLGGSGSSSTGGSGAGGKDQKYDCYCNEINLNKIDSGTIPPADKWLKSVTATSVDDAVSSVMRDECSIYNFITCTKA